MSRVLMVVVLTAVDSWRGRIVGLKLRWQPTIAALFRPNGAANTMKPTGVFLYSRGETFLWWCGGWRRPESGDRMRERASPTRGERESEIMLRYERVYGTPVPLNTVHRWISDETIGWLWLARSAGWSDGLDERSFDRVWRGTPKSRYTGWRGATGSKLRLFQGLRCVWVLIWCGKPYCILLNQRFRSKHY